MPSSRPSPVSWLASIPPRTRRIGAAVLPLVEASGFNVRILLTILGLIGVLIVVVACANVASVTVAQALARRHELAVHAALGATRGDRIRRLLIESVIVSAVAGVIGLLVAGWGLAGLRWLGSSSFGFADMQMNGRVLAACVLIACATPIGFGVLPALRMAPPDPQELRDGTRAAGATRRGRRLRNLIVAVQTGAAMVLMVQIGLFIRTTWKLSDVVPGFEPAQVLTFHVALPASRYGPPESIDRFIATLLERLEGLPGVESAGIIDRLPIADDEQEARLATEATAAEPLERRPVVARSAIAGDLLAALRIPVRRGRTMTEAEITGAAPVVVINEEAARRFWPGRDPIGSRLALDSASGQETWLDIIGIVGNLRNSDVDQGPLPQVFVATTRQRSADLAVVVKSVGADPLHLVPAIRAQVAAIDPRQPIHDVASMRQVMFDDLATTVRAVGDSLDHWFRCAGAFGGRNLRSRLLLGRAAPSRDRRSHGAWRQSGVDGSPDRRAISQTGGAREPARTRRGRGTGAAPRSGPAGDGPSRSGELHGRPPADSPVCPARDAAARAPRCIGQSR